MCGASDQQNELASEEAAAYKQANAMTAEQYGNQSAIYKQMTPMFESIFSKGPNQEGFSGAETQDLNAEAVQGTAQNYNQAAKAVGEQTAAEGGGTNPLPTGAQLQLKQQIANSAAATESGEESQIKEADYSQGYNEWEAAAGGLSGIATGENPIGYENAATGAAGAANSEANAVEEANNSWINAAIGAVGQIGGGLAAGFCPAKGSMYLMMDGSQKLVEELVVGEVLRGIGGDPQVIEEIQSAIAPVVKVAVLTHQERVLIARNSLTHAYALPLGGFVVAVKALECFVSTIAGRGFVTRVERDGEEMVFNVITDGSHTYCADGVWALGVGDAERRVDMATWGRLGEQMVAEV